MATKVQVYEDPGTGKWSVRVVGDEETEPDLHGSKEEAVEHGRKLAAERGVDLLVHGEDGRTETIEAAGNPAERG